MLGFNFIPWLAQDSKTAGKLNGHDRIGSEDENVLTAVLLRDVKRFLPRN